MKEIKMPIYYCEDEKTSKKDYDWDEMAKELELRISEILDREVSIEIEDEGFINLEWEGE